MSRHGTLAALTLTSVMLAGAWQIVAAAADPAGLEFPRSWLDFREGRSTGALEKQLDQKLPARSALIGVANSVRYLLTGSGGEQVQPGKDNWLFLTEELRFDAAGSANLKVRAELLGAAARSLESQGVKLIVALVPDKARVYSSKLATGRYPDYNSSRYGNALSAFQKQGVTTVNLLQPLVQAASRAEVYYRTDTHWNQTGAKVAAEAVASTIKPLGLELEKASFSSKNDAPVERPGDLIRLMGLGDTAKMLGLQPDTEAPDTTLQVSADSVDLLGDSAVQVVLTGTSYSLRANFVGYLQQAISSKVLNAAKDGGGFLQAMTLYLNNEAFRTSKPRVIIWEVPERFLWLRLEGERDWLGKDVGSLLSGPIGISEVPSD
jgi:alginate O-acetyltransferase complex protein AlgJ